MRKWSFLLILTGFVLSLMCSVSSDAKEYCYKGETLHFSKGVLRNYKGTLCLAVSEKNCKELPGIRCEYVEQAPCVRIKSQNHVATVFDGEKRIYVDGKQVHLSQAAKELPNKKNRIMLVPFEELLKALNIQCRTEKNGRKVVLKKGKYDYHGKTTRTTYKYSFATYIKKQYKRTNQASKKEYKRLLKSSGDATDRFQYMRVDTFREIDPEVFYGYYNNQIEIYCRINKMSKKKSVLYGRKNAKALLGAAKKYNLDPVYFACQTFLESAYGTSTLAKGHKIGKKKVYNLYGIKAYDNNPEKYGFRYAKKKGWTSINKALEGAAAYLSSGYIHSKYKQNTIFKLRYTPNKGLWHQYASDPFYAEKIGGKYQEMSVCYSQGAKYLYDMPRYR